MEATKRGRGRPRLNVPNGRCSRRQTVNSMYVNKAAQLISEAATEITDGKLLWYSDDATWTIKSKDGILEQIGRMLIQDNSKSFVTDKEIRNAITELRDCEKQLLENFDTGR